MRRDAIYLAFLSDQHDVLSLRLKGMRRNASRLQRAALSRLSRVLPLKAIRLPVSG